MPIEIGVGGEQMPLLCGPCWWSWWDVEAIHAASPDAACPGLHRKPLDAAIGWLFAPYCLGGRQNSKTNNDVLCTHFDGYFGGHRDAAVLLRASPDDGGSPGLSYATKHRHRVSTRSDSINRSSQCCYVAWCLRCEVLGMAGCGLTRQYLHRGVTYKNEDKDLADGAEYL